MLIKTFGEIATNYPDWVLRLYGNGKKKEELESYVKTKGLENQIFFMGEVSDIQNRMKDSAIFVLPSKQEGMPNALPLSNRTRQKDLAFLLASIPLRTLAVHRSTVPRNYTEGS